MKRIVIDMTAFHSENYIKIMGARKGDEFHLIMEIKDYHITAIMDIPSFLGILDHLQQIWGLKSQQAVSWFFPIKSIKEAEQ